MATLPLAHNESGIHETLAESVAPGSLYQFVLDGREFPDPYARFLPFGVHGPCRVEASRHVRAVHPSPEIRSSVIYELHVGTFTKEGTYRAASQRLPYLKELGVTTIELMPLAAFAGARGWGYDGVALYSPFAGYGEPEDLRLFIETAHALGMAVILDVVYNHFGPSGNYLSAYSPEYFTERHHTPWGPGPDFTNPYMRQLVLENTRYWLDEFGFDGLRLDATHEIKDDSETHILRELADLAHSFDPPRLLIAEDDRNEPRLITEMGLDALWADDFHHQVHVLLTKEQDGYYANFEPKLEPLARTIERGFLYEGQENPTTGKARGAPADLMAAHNFVYALQNHDQIGNRAFGDRLSQLTNVEAYAAVSMLLLFLPMVPLLFMGQEWAASTPFAYFTDHERELGEQVTRGRRQEFGKFAAFKDPAVQNQIPDPQAERTFVESKLRWEELEREPHRRILTLYRSLLKYRASDPVLNGSSRERLRAEAHGALLIVKRWLGRDERSLLVNFSSEMVAIDRYLEGSEVVLMSGSLSFAERNQGLAPYSSLILKGTRS